MTEKEIFNLKVGDHLLFEAISNTDSNGKSSQLIVTETNNQQVVIKVISLTVPAEWGWCVGTSYELYKDSIPQWALRSTFTKIPSPPRKKPPTRLSLLK